MAEELIYKITIDGNQSLKSIDELVKRNKELAKILETVGAKSRADFDALATEFSKNREEVTKFRDTIKNFTNDSTKSLVSLKGSYIALQQEQKKLILELKRLPEGTKEFKALETQVKSNRKTLDDFNRRINSSRNVVADYGIFNPYKA